MSVLIHDARFAPGKDPSGSAARSHGAIGASSLVCLLHLGVPGKAGAAFEERKGTFGHLGPFKYRKNKRNWTEKKDVWEFSMMEQKV